MAASLIGGRVWLHIGYTAAGHVSENAPQQHEIEDSLFVVSIAQGYRQGKSTEY